MSAVDPIRLSTRMLAAILSADVFGYSRLMAEDDMSTIADLNTSKELMRGHIAGHRGRVVDSPGDEMLCEFGSAVDAVTAAIAIQRDLIKWNANRPEHRRMMWRIGINLGDVVLKNEALYGDGVNIAARMQALSEPEGVCISGSIFDQIDGKVSVKFESAGEQVVKNIDRPVRTYHWKEGASRGSNVTLLAMPVGISIAVLPFVNLGAEASEDYFSDGLTEDIITELARFRELHVLARNTTFQYRGQAVNVSSMGKQLGVRYVLEGSVRRAGSRIRINAQLIEVSTGAHVWADKYDREMVDVFALQDEITGKIVGALAGGWSGLLQQSGRLSASRKRPADLSAYELVLKANSAMLKTTTDYEVAKDMLQRATQIDPLYARPRHELAWFLLRGWIFRLERTPRPPEEFKRMAIESIEIDPADAFARRTAAYGYFFDAQLGLFDREARRALELAPYNAEIFAQLGMAYTFSGQWDYGVALAQKGYSLNQISAGGWYQSAMHYYQYRNGDYQAALAMAREHPVQELTETCFKYIACYGQLGELDKARSYFQTCLAQEPNFSAEFVRDVLRLWNFPEAFIAQYMEGFAKAGYPLSDRSCGINASSS